MELSTKQQFWVWFQYNSEIYRCLDRMAAPEAQYWMDEIEVHLRSFAKKIYACIGLPDDGGVAKLIISAHGNYNYFKRVEELVSKAPSIPGWEIIAFMPPCPIDFGISAHYGHTGIDPYNLWFIPTLIEDEPPFIVVFAEEYKREDLEFEAAVEAVIVNLLGERSANLGLSAVVVACLDDFDAGERSEMMKLQELPAYLERVNVSSCFINERGELEEQKGMLDK